LYYYILGRFLENNHKIHREILVVEEKAGIKSNKMKLIRKFTKTSENEEIRINSKSMHRSPASKTKKFRVQFIF